MEDIDDLIRGEEKRIITPYDMLPQVIAMAQAAYDKADRIGPMIKSMTDRDLEWSGFMLAEKGDPLYVVRDIHIQKGQDIRKGDVKISGDDIAQASVAIAERNARDGTNLYVIGWIHGHGTCLLKPSDIDMGNFGVVLNSTSLNTEQHIYIPLSLFETEVTTHCEDGRLIYTGEAVEDAKVEHRIIDGPSLEELLKESGVQLMGDPKDQALDLLRQLLQKTDTVYYEAQVFGFSYFVIVNNKHEKPYAATACTTERTITRKRQSKLITDLEILQVIDDRELLTDDRLEKEIVSAIDLPKKGIFTFFGWDDETGQTPKGKKRWKKNKGVYTPTRTTGNYTSAPRYSPIYVPRNLIEKLEERIKACEDIDPDQVAEARGLLELLKQVDKEWTIDRQDRIIDAYFEKVYGLAEQTDDDLITEQKDKPPAEEKTDGETEQPTQ